MTRIASITLIVVLTAIFAHDAAAQWNVARYGMERSRVYTTFGLDPAFVTSVGYARVGSVFDHDMQLSGELGVATASFDTRDFRTRVGVQTSLLRWRSVNLTGSATAVTRGTENSVYRGLNFGADFTGTLGVYRNRWFASGEFGKDKAVITRVTFTNWYRDNFYPDAKNGWYLNAGGTYHYGLASGITLGSTELAARFGWLRTERFNDVTPPIYGSVGVGYGF